MTTLYIDRKQTRLSIESNTLVCFINEQRQRPVPLLLLEQLVISSAIELTSTVLLKLTEAGVNLVFINPRNSKQHATLIGPHPKNPHIRLAQYAAHTNSLFSQTIAQQWITAKVRNQQRLLQRYLTSRPDLRLPLQKAIQQLTQSLITLNHPVPIDQLRGVEGYAAKVSFAVYRDILPNELGFHGRKRRPPTDPVNACLSLAYTLLHNRATQLATTQGLDPMLGFLHEPKYSRDSLAADIIEPWRPYVDEWVLQLFANRTLRKQDFSYDQSSCLLAKAGRYRFYAAYDAPLKKISRGMRLQLYQLRKKLLETTSRDHDETALS